MDYCYYCGHLAGLVCDNDYPQCTRSICLNCAIPQLEKNSDIARGAFCLCKEHAKFQVKANETMPEYFERMDAIRAATAVR